MGHENDNFKCFLIIYSNTKTIIFYLLPFLIAKRNLRLLLGRQMMGKKKKKKALIRTKQKLN
jgi:hypothetical protein